MQSRVGMKNMKDISFVGVSNVDADHREDISGFRVERMEMVDLHGFKILLSLVSMLQLLK